MIFLKLQICPLPDLWFFCLIDILCIFTSNKFLQYRWSRKSSCRKWRFGWVSPGFKGICLGWFQLLNITSVNFVCSSERYRVQSDSFEDMWLVVKELVQRFDQHFSKLGIKDFKKSFSGTLPLQDYFLSVDRHFQVKAPHLTHRGQA